MKKLSFVLAITLPGFLFNGCKKTDIFHFHRENCQVLSTAISGLSNYTTTYEYGADGFINSHVTNMGDFTIENKYHRKNNGLIESCDSYFDGELSVTYKYTYSGGRVVRLDGFYEGNHLGEVVKLDYNAKGLISSITDEITDYPQYSTKKLFEYNQLGQYTRVTRMDLSGNVSSLEIDHNIGTASPASEIYLMQHGLPFQLTFLYAYSISVPGVGSTVEYYGPDENGKLVRQIALKEQSIQLNSRGYLSSLTYVDEKGEVASKADYSFDCSERGKGLE